MCFRVLVWSGGSRNWWCCSSHFCEDHQFEWKQPEIWWDVPGSSRAGCPGGLWTKHIMKEFRNPLDPICRCPLEGMSGTRPDCSSQWWHRTFVGKPSSVVCFHQMLSPFPGVWAVQEMFFSTWMTKGTLLSCRCPPQGQSCPTSAPQRLWEINPSTQTYFIGVFLFSLHWGCFFALLTQNVPHSSLQGCAHILLLSSQSRQPCFETQCRCWVIAVHLSATLFTNLKNLTARKLLVKGHHKSSGSPHSECAGCDPIPAAGQLTFNVTQKRI